MLSQVAIKMEKYNFHYYFKNHTKNLSCALKIGHGQQNQYECGQSTRHYHRAEFHRSQSFFYFLSEMKNLDPQVILGLRRTKLGWVRIDN